MKGTVIRTLPLKGFCFIMGEDGHSRFAHASSFTEGQTAFERLHEGQAVSFDPEENARGKRAANVRTAER